MPRKQTRRSISIKGTTYDRLKAYCLKHDRSMSSIVEETLRASFPEALAPEAKVVAWDGSEPGPPQAAAPTPDALFEEAFEETSTTRPPPSKPERSRRGHTPF